MSEGLIEAQSSLSAEAPGHRRAGHGRELPDPLNPKSAHGIQRLLIQAKSLHRKTRHCISGPARRDNRLPAIAGDSPSRSRRIGDGGASSNALRGQSLHKVSDDICLASEKMVGARNIDPNPVGRVRRDNR